MADRDVLQRAEQALNDARATLEDAKQGFSDLAAWAVRNMGGRMLPSRVFTLEDVERVKNGVADWLARLQKDIDHVAIVTEAIQDRIAAVVRERAERASETPTLPPPSIMVNGLPTDPTTIRRPIEEAPVQVPTPVPAPAPAAPTPEETPEGPSPRDRFKLIELD